MNSEKICFISIDNVLSDLNMQVLNMSGKNIKGLQNKKPLSFEEEQALYTSEKLKNFSEMFWRTMPVKYDAHKLLDYCVKKYDKIKIISKYEPPISLPYRLLYVREAKIRWVMQHFSDYVDIDDIIVSKYNKTNFMEKDKVNILIDHNYNEVQNWRKNDGIGILYFNYQQFEMLSRIQPYRYNGR